MYQKVRCTCSVVCFFLSILWQIVPTIFSASQQCNIAATLFRSVTTLFQRCYPKNFRCNLPCVRSLNAVANHLVVHFPSYHEWNVGQLGMVQWWGHLPPTNMATVQDFEFVVCCLLQLCDNEPGLLRPLSQLLILTWKQGRAWQRLFCCHKINVSLY